MALTFYPHPEDAHKGSIHDTIETLMTAAEQYKAIVLDPATAAKEGGGVDKRAPRDLLIAYNWEAIATVLREIRELPEGNKEDKTKKANLLNKLAEVYEILRSAKMAKLEAVRLALSSEANQLLNR